MCPLGSTQVGPEEASAAPGACLYVFILAARRWRDIEGVLEVSKRCAVALAEWGRRPAMSRWNC